MYTVRGYYVCRQAFINRLSKTGGLHCIHTQQNAAQYQKASQVPSTFATDTSTSRSGRVLHRSETICEKDNNNKILLHAFICFFYKNPVFSPRRPRE